MVSYRLRVYADPIGVNSISVQTTSGVQVGIVTPLGDNTPGYDEDSITAPLRFVPSIKSGYEFTRWVINADGVKTYSTDIILYFYNNQNATDVQVRIEFKQESIPQTYYANIVFNANGGSGVPNPLYGSSQQNYINFTIPYLVPSRQGYSFVGWHRNPASTYAEYYPGSNVQVTDVSTVYPGPTFTLYAVWELVTDDGVLYICDGATFYRYKPYIYVNGWQEATPYIFDGGSWRKSQ